MDDDPITADAEPDDLPMVLAERILLYLRDGTVLSWETAPLSPEAAALARQRP